MAPLMSVPSSSLPAGARRLLYFQVFNIAGSSIALGPPLILLARHLGGGTWDASLLTAFATLAIVVQLVASPILEHFGYRRSFAGGWLVTAGFMALVALLPLGIIKGEWAVTALLAFVFAFHAVRSFAQLAWFPWLARILPTELRGRFVGLDVRVTAVTGLVALLVTSLVIGQNPGGTTFALIYGFASLGLAAAGLTAWQVPDNDPRIAVPARGEAVSVWKAARHLFRRRRFRRAMTFIAVYYFFFAPIPLILILLQEGPLTLGARDILLLQAGTQVGTAATSALWGRTSDRFGTRPLLRMASVGTLIVFTMWASCIIRNPGLAILGLFSALLGVFQGAQSVGLMRLLMQVCPPKLASQSTAIFQAVGSLAASLSPLAVGAILSEFPKDSATGFALAMLFIGAAGVGAQYLLGRIPETGRERTHAVLRHAIKWVMR